MRFTGPCASLPAHPSLNQAQQEEIIFRTAAEIGVPAVFLGAVRIAEAGGTGREFGVLSVDAPTYEDQTRAAAISIRNNTWRYVAQRQGAFPLDQTGELSDEFIGFMANRWAPKGAANDPGSLNANWPKNVSDAYRASGVV